MAAPRPSSQSTRCEVADGCRNVAYRTVTVLFEKTPCCEPCYAKLNAHTTMPNMHALEAN